MNKLKLRLLLEQFFLEDIGDRDVSSDLIFGKAGVGEIVFIAKQSGIFCGEEVIKTGFHILDPQAVIEMMTSDGERIEKGQQLAIVKGQISDLLKGERVVLNLVQRMSGIATKTEEAIVTLGDPKIRICDTRKTTPGLRMLEKYAVRSGGGYNHRYGLYDAVMIKDNHISFSGSITKAVEEVRNQIGHMVKIEVETESRDQVIEAAACNVDCIMFDNRTPNEINELIKFVPEGITTEASGGINLTTLPGYRGTGVDYISLGFLTHTVKALDISVKVNASS